MAHDVFISYASEDKPVADAICATLEARGIRCWIAPRDVLPGTNYGSSVVNAINASRILVLVFSSNANTSPPVMREMERGASKGIPIIPFRIEDVPLSADMEYFISAPHWLDALTPPLEQHIQHLADTADLLLSRTNAGEEASGGREPPPRSARRREENQRPSMPAPAMRKPVRRLPLVAALSGVSVLGSWLLWSIQQPSLPTSPEGQVALCTQHLNAIGRALAAFEREKGQLPLYLSELYPQYLSDRQLLHCPADPSPGKHGLAHVSEDPKLRVSYVYEMALQGWTEPSSFLGPEPITEFRTQRDWRMAQRKNFGNRAPLVRCWHHRPAMERRQGFEGKSDILSVTATGEVYRSGATWEHDPQTVLTALAELERDLDAGALQFQSRWRPGSLGVYFITTPTLPEFRARYRSTAQKLMSMVPAFPRSAAGDLNAAAGALYWRAGDTDKAIAAGEAALCLSRPGPFSAYWILADLYRQTGKHGKAIALLHRQLAGEPTNTNLMRLLVTNYEATGQHDKAAEWRTKAERQEAEWRANAERSAQ